MQVNIEYVNSFISRKDISQNELARQMNLSKGTLSNVLLGRRGVGRKFIASFLRVFPEAEIEKLVINSKAIK
ncbi:helix-turn-helix domain-containing protein [Caloranaerobacter ferrireducens]|uniref:helix-turn-helix domain-containing protein n=1 Tax=Caloranaerobacter ferrireducens TaxID=1323370 RepID=UPI00084D7AC1|nr:helix-turn-helix transcriptional regulator [Caloranaerobacter ferrireducens]